MEPLTLTEDEIVEATGYKQGARQIKVLLKAGIPADRRPDGSVRVWRHRIGGITQPVQARKHPQLTSDMEDV